MAIACCLDELTPFKNVTTACKACRERKIKCDGALPRCAVCVRADRLCLYEDKHDRRRLSLPPTISILRARITTLTEQLRAAGIVPAPVSESDAVVADKVLAGLSLAPLAEEEVVPMESGQPDISPSTSSFQSTPLPNPTAFTDSDNGDPIPLSVGTGFDDFNIDWNDSPVSLDWLWAGPFAPELEAPFNFDPLLSIQQSEVPPENNTHATNGLDVQHEDESESEFASQIAARFGSLHIVGTTLRFFGTTANAHLFVNGQSDGHYAKLRTMARDGARLLHDANLDTPVDPAFEQHLVEFFFAWHNSCHYVVDRLVHESGHKQYAAGQDCRGLYSPVLLNAMWVLSFWTNLRSLSVPLLII